MSSQRQPILRVGSPPERPLLVFDGDCGFCRRWVARWREAAPGRFDDAPSQEVAARFPEIPAEAFARSVQLIEPDGRVTEGAEAVFRTRALSPRGGLALWAYEHVPGVAAVSERAYRFVAARRVLFSRITRLLWGAHVEQPSYSIARCLFLRLLGATYLCAFASLAVQIQGLAGSHGVLPAASYLDAVRAQTGANRYWFLPTVFWLGVSDRALSLLCWSGAALSLMQVAGLLPALTALLLWGLYLSLTVVGQDFLSFQWDILLLEAGLLAVLLSPLTWRCRLACPSRPGRFPMFLMHWLLFRLMFSSGAVKLLSADTHEASAWRDLTALTYHYETQPLPTWTSWYTHHLPVWFHEMSCVFMFVIELGLPLLIFAPRRLRLSACAGLIGLQVLIAATGNYAFFNLLSIALCVLLLDDTVWPQWTRRWLNRSLVPASAVRDTDRAEVDPMGSADVSADPDGRTGTPGPVCAPGRTGAEPPVGTTISVGFPDRGAPRTPAGAASSAPAPRPKRSWPWWVVLPAGAFLFFMSLIPFAATLRLRIPWPALVVSVFDKIEPFRSVNGYGLFAVMTTSRPEIIIEGSDDGSTWLPYEFRWKPGDLARRPRFVAPHQPRLDWQMWFAALGDARANPWFVRLLAKLLEGSPTVTGLLAKNPFPDHPPRYARALLYDYHFTDAATRRSTGNWWRRELLGEYYPVVSLRAHEDGAK